MIIITAGGFSEGYIRNTLIDATTASETARLLLENEWLFRLGFVVDLIMVIADIAIAIVFFDLFKSVHFGLSLLSAVFRLIQAIIIAINLMNHYSALVVISMTD